MEDFKRFINRRLNEDWKQSSKEYLNAKDVLQSHRDKLNSLNYELNTDYGDYNVQIKFNNLYEVEIKLQVWNKDGHYVGTKWFKNGKELKSFLFDENGGLTQLIYNDIKTRFKRLLSDDSITPKDLQKKISELNSKIDNINNVINIEIDEDEIDKKLHKFTVYYQALKNRESKKYDLKWKAQNDFRNEHNFEVGDTVLGKSGRTSMTAGKPYVISEIDGDVALVKPENGRGKFHYVNLSDIILDSDDVDKAINNPDDPKYNKFDKQKYMMNRYSAENMEESFTEREYLLNKYSKYTDPDELADAIEADTGDKPEIRFSRRNGTVFVYSNSFTLLGFYQFDEDTGEYQIDIQSVELPEDLMNT